VKVTLTRKLARVINGVDLTACHEGEIIDIRDQDARVLIAEGWAVPVTTQLPAARHRPRYVGDVETSYSFSGYDTLPADFWADVDAWRKRR
jgi:hypothetical protein